MPHKAVNLQLLQSHGFSFIKDEGAFREEGDPQTTPVPQERPGPHKDLFRFRSLLSLMPQQSANGAFCAAVATSWLVAAFCAGLSQRCRLIYLAEAALLMLSSFW